MDDDHEDEIVHRQLETEDGNPGVQVARIVAELEETDVTELANVWECIDEALDAVFSNPPAPEAQLEVTYSYEGYRVTVEQNGRARLVKTG